MTQATVAMAAADYEVCAPDRFTRAHRLWRRAVEEHGVGQSWQGPMEAREVVALQIRQIEARAARCGDKGGWRDSI